MSSRRITALNNAGIRSLQSGLFREAILSFRHAIQCARASVEQEATASASATSSSYGGSSSSSVCSEAERPTAYSGHLHQEEDLFIASVRLEHIDHEAMLECSPHNIFDIYQGAFLLPKVESLAAYQTEISIVLFYNLALTYHLSAMVSSSSSPHASSCHPRHAHLKEALRFYKYALNLVSCSSSSTLDGDDDDDDRLKLDASGCAMIMGTLTNLGYIFTHYWRTHEAASCMEQLGEMLQSPSAAAAMMVGLLSPEDEEFFASAVCYYYYQTFGGGSGALAPAA